MSSLESINPESGIGYLELLSEEIEACIREFRAEKKNGAIDLHFSQGDIASVDISENCENCPPGHEVGAFNAAQCALFAARKVRWFMAQKKSGRVSLIFEQGEIASVKSFQRLSPGRKNGATINRV